ncbi:MAG: phage tail protein [Sulfuricella denitrificans]|nr:phage tail protein [Sulfuricella denitrificans]
MSITLSTGSTIAIAGTYGASKTFSSASNAAESVLSFAADPGLAGGDVVEVSSGWGRLDKRVVRIKSVSGAGPYLATLEGVDTSDTNHYPSGAGVGTIREIATWVDIPQIKDIGSGGGDQQYANITAMSDDTERKIPTIRSAVTMDLTVYDDPTLSYYSTVVAASDSSAVTALKIATKNGAYLYANAYWSIQKVPNMSTNEALTSKISMSYAADPIRYAS